MTPHTQECNYIASASTVLNVIENLLGPFLTASQVATSSKLCQINAHPGLITEDLVHTMSYEPSHHDGTVVEGKLIRLLCICMLEFYESILSTQHAAFCQSNSWLKTRK